MFFLVGLSAVCFGWDKNQTSTNTRLLHVSPNAVYIGGGNRRQQLLITAAAKDGSLRDVTHEAQLTMDDENVAVIGDAIVSGVGDGTASLRILYDGIEQSVPIVVDSFDRHPDVQFVNDVMPLFSSLGCNSGGCHGKQSGQNGFKLSVFGFDPRADFNALVKEGRGRRVFPGAPQKSLLVTKPIGAVPHGGGQRIVPESLDHELLVQWIRQGTPWGDDNAPQLATIRIEPTHRVMLMQDGQQILVTAVFSDSSERDVTHASAYTSNTKVIASVNQAGKITTGTVPGEAAITVNYMGHVGAVRILVPRTSGLPSYPKIPIKDPIDELVWSKLRKLHVAPSVLCDDSTFLRRLLLTAIGTLPTVDEAQSFLNDKDPNKRRRMIDAVLERDEFADYWTQRFADVLLINREKLGERGAYEFHLWLREQFANNRPYDQWVRQLITASGNSGKYGPVNFYRALDQPGDLAKAVSQAFLGVRIDCAQCHHHPFDQWGQKDFYGLASYFNGLKRKKLGSGRELIYHANYRPSKMPLTGEEISAQPLGGPPSNNIEDGDPRVELADWLTNRDNPWFARLVANRMWKQFLGRGLIEPEDDLRSTNPATNELLLNYLAEQVVNNDYDLKTVMRLILNSRVFQLSSRPNNSNRDDEQNFSHYIVRRLPAAVLLDAISEVTGSPEHFPGMQKGTRAIQLWDNRLPSYFLDTFGRSERASPCECGNSSEPTMSQALHLMNAPEIEEKIARSTGRVARLIEDSAEQDRIVRELCLATLGRPPDDKERAVADQLFAAQQPRQAAEDFLWTLLNSYEFLFLQ